MENDKITEISLKYTEFVDIFSERIHLFAKLHGPSMFAVEAKIYGVLYKQSSSIAFDKTSSYWSAPKNC